MARTGCGRAHGELRNLYQRGVQGSRGRRLGEGERQGYRCVLPSFPGEAAPHNTILTRLLLFFSPRTLSYLRRPGHFAGITNQRESAVAWSRKTGKPLCRLIVWDDARTKNTVAHFEAKLQNVGIEVHQGSFKKGEEGIEALRQL